MSSLPRTSLTINFKSSVPNDMLSIQVDSRKDGYNGGNGTFYPGDSPVLLEYRSPSVVVEDRYATDGSLSIHGTGSHYVEEFITVANEAQGNLSKPFYGDFSLLGQWGQGATIKSIESSQITLSARKICVLKVRYKTSFVAIRLSGASGEAPVLVYVAGYVV